MQNSIRFEIQGASASTPDADLLRAMQKQLADKENLLERVQFRLVHLREQIDNGDDDDCLKGQMRLAALQGVTVSPAEVNKVLDDIRDVINDAIAIVVAGQISPKS